MSGGDEEMQTRICHHMEDPTFDATVMAVHPQMRCRPIFRPPVAEIPETGPCRWRVSIEDTIGVAEDCPFLAQTSQTLAANFEFSPPEPGGEGMTDYSGEFRRDMCLEYLDHGILALTCREFMLDVFLLNYGCYNAIAARHGEQHIVPMAQAQYHHLAPVTVYRLRNAFGIVGDDMDAILKVLQLNPFTPDEYFGVGFAKVTDTRGLAWLNDCAGAREPIKRGIASLMTVAPESPGFDRLVQEVNPQAVVRPVDPTEAAGLPGAGRVINAWEIMIDTDAEPAVRSEWAELAGQAMWDLDNTTHRYLYDRYDAQAG
jgi:hypothetical protein